MTREYFVRGERKTVEEIEDVVAIRVMQDQRGESRARASRFGTATRVSAAGLPDETLAAFSRARWLLVQPSPETMRALEAGDAVTDAEQTGRLVRRSSGRFAIVTRRLNVQLRPDISPQDAERVVAERGLQILLPLRFAPNLFEVDTLVHADAIAASVDLAADLRFVLAEPAMIEHVPARLTPSDPLFDEQWHWANIGQQGGMPGADVGAERAWNETRGAGIRVAVIDNGFNATHEDLAPGVGRGSGSFRTNTINPALPEHFVQGTAGMPNGNHGTFCAGMVGARQNNGRGGCGAAPECELMLIACLRDQVGTQTTLARAVSYAANPAIEISGADPGSGADILVSSLGPNGAVWDLTATLQLAIEFAAVNGRNGRSMAIFWAASNGANVDITLDEVVSHRDVIAVARSTNADLEDNAARGATLQLVAPGVDVVSTRANGGYGVDSGCSFAAPSAAGCAALALSMNPALTRDQLRAIMRESADRIGGVVYDENGHHPDYGFGRVNAYSAILLAAPWVMPPSGNRRVFPRNRARNTKSIYAVTTDQRLAQVWDAAGWHLDFPAEYTPAAALRFQGSPAVFGRDPVRNTKSIYAVTTDGRLAQIYDGAGWYLDCPAEAAGYPDLRFRGSPAVFGRNAAGNTKSIYVITTDGRLAQVWDGDGWYLDFPAEYTPAAALRFQGSPAVFGRDPVRNTKSIYAVTTDGRLTQIYDGAGWYLDCPAEAAGYPDLRFHGSPAVFGRDAARNTKSIYVVTTDGHLAQIYDEGGGWHLDFPAASAGYADLRFQNSPAVFGRDPARNTKSIYAISTDGRLTQIYDTDGWHLDFPAAASGHADLRFEGSPAVFGRDAARNTKSIYAVTTDGRLAEVWDADGWHLDFPAEHTPDAGVRFQGTV